MKPRTLAYTEKEGGNWLLFREGASNAPVHAILFDDGTMWDSYNGWRSWRLTGNQITHLKEVVFGGGA